MTVRDAAKHFELSKSTLPNFIKGKQYMYEVRNPRPKSPQA